ncbi:MAG: hypothetical protein QXV69_02015 [Sulfolobaceae archaeon]
MKNKKELILAVTVSSAIIVAILSMPDILEPIAENIIRELGYILPMALLVIGIIHGLKPDEHTWPITISYALMQKNIYGAVKSTVVFALALTTIWTALSALVGEVINLGLATGVLDPEVDIIVGLTMIGVAILYLLRSKSKEDPEGVKSSAPDYKLIWIHGVAAAFGGDFFVVLLLSVSITTLLPSFPTFLVGLLFGLGSLASQLVVVLLAYSGLVKSIKSPQTLVNVGKLSLLFLGIFMIVLGIFSYLIPS